MSFGMGISLCKTQPEVIVDEIRPFSRFDRWSVSAMAMLQQQALSHGICRSLDHPTPPPLAAVCAIR